MKLEPLKTFNIFYNPKNKKSVLLAKDLSMFIADKFPALKKDLKSPAYVIVLGGDGTILEAARRYKNNGSIIAGLNMGTVGFLASARNEKNFQRALSTLFKGKINITERLMISARVIRERKIVFQCDALNEAVIKNLLGIVELQASVEDHPIQYIRGEGILVSTATGSTAYNLSAHGPIVMPGIRCLIVTELMDHNIPTPSIVISYEKKIKIRVINFRKRGRLSFAKTGQEVDVVLSADGESIFGLEPGDEIIIESSSSLIKFAELEKNYFFKSLEEKFGFK